MCGIVGLYRPRAAAAPVDTGRLVAARDRMAHRGPDGAGLWYGADGRVALGHRRLAIIDPSPAGAQPMSDPESGLTIVFNGEIYNHGDLRRELTDAGEVFQTRTDTEVLLRWYARYREAGLTRLSGMFAFALWDARRGGLLLARDGLGIKPLYMFDDGETVGFASECRALATLLPERLAGRSDPAAWLGFHMFGWVPEPFSPWAAIGMLPAGSWRWIDSSGRKAGRFFDVVEEIVAAENTGPALPRSRRESVSALRDHLSASVNRHLVADVPVSLFLSAGVDSTMIAELAIQNGARMGAVTLAADRFAGTGDDEAPEAAATARRFGMPHHVRHLQASDLSDGMAPLLSAMDQPTTDGVNTFMVAQAAAAAGYKVALSGVGVDELFGGYPSFLQIPRLTAWVGPLARLPWLGPALGRGVRRIGAPLAAAFTSPKYASVVEYAGREADAYLLRRGLFLPWELAGEGGLSAAEVAVTLARVRAATGGDGRYETIRSPHLRVLALETELYMRNQLLRDADWAGMAASVEIRTPLADAALTREAIGLIARLTPPPGKPEIAAGVGPASAAAASRPKTGFNLPIRSWMVESAADRATIGDGRGLRGWGRFVFARWCRHNGLDTPEIARPCTVVDIQP